MARPIVFDLTHLLHRLAYEAPSGIDQVDLLFARHFSGPGKIAAASHYGTRRPKIVAPVQLSGLVERVEDRWRETIPIEADDKFTLASAWIRAGASARSHAPAKPPARGVRWHYDTKIRPYLRYVNVRPPAHAAVPEEAIYLNVAQHATEIAKFFNWLTPRRDVSAVFFLHDLLPLDYPEYWWRGHETLFRRRVEVMLRHAAALITSSDAVRDRVYQELKATGRPRVPILSCPLPSPLEAVKPAATLASELSDAPYFVVLGTIEPRKNHILLLNIWRDLAARGGAVPKLILIGRRGWENEHAVAMLERSPGLRDHVREVADVSAPGVTRLLANASALLMPSFAEGYGLPLVEALSLGTPVVASDIAVFREVTQGKAIFRDPVDGLGWSTAVMALSDPRSDIAIEARRLAESFEPQSNAGYFQRVESFLAAL